MLRTSFSLCFCLIVSCFLWLIHCGHAEASGNSLVRSQQVSTDSFRFGIYSINLVPPEEAFHEWANAGISFAWINRAGMERAYGGKEIKNINLLAKSYGIKLYTQLTYEPQIMGMDEEKMRQEIERHVNWVNALPDSDAIVSWGISDEIENPSHIEMYSGNDDSEKRAAMSKALKKFGVILREIDPTRKIEVNHNDPPWIAAGEDEAWCSTPFAMKMCKGNIDKRLEEARKHGFDNMILVAQVMSVCPWWVDMTYSGYPKNVTGAEILSQYSAADIIKEYVWAAYENKAAGIIFYCYDGLDRYSYSPHIFKDIEGRDIMGRWSAFVGASRKVRETMGQPICQLLWYAPGSVENAYCYDQKTKKLKLHTVVTKGKEAIQKVIFEYSSDAGYHWKSIGLGEFGEGKPLHYVLEFDPTKLEKSKKGLFRSRAFDGKRWSAWSVSHFFTLWIE